MNEIFALVLPYVSTFDLVFWINTVLTAVLCVAGYNLFPKFVGVPFYRAVNGDATARRYLAVLGAVFFILSGVILAISLYYGAEGTITSFAVMSLVQMVFQKHFTKKCVERSFAEIKKFENKDFDRFYSAIMS